MSAGLGDRVIRGALWTIAGRWTLRLIALGSTAVLARLLTPADFGLIAMGMVVIGLVEAVFDFGLVQTLVRHPDTIEADFDTAWTMGLLHGIAVMIVAAAAAPFAADYFDEPRVATLLWVLAPLAFARSCENIGTVKFQKELDFHKTFRFEVMKRLVVTVLTIGAALWFKDYRALLAGNILGTLAGVGISYAIHAHRPRLTLSRFRAIWRVSRWIMLTQIGGYLSTNVDRVILGGRADATGMGHYSVAGDVAMLPYEGVIGPTNRVLLPAFAQVKHAPERLAKAYARALGAQCTLGLPASAGVALVAHAIVEVVLGSQWLAAIPIVQLLALRYACMSLTAAGTNLVIALDRQRQFAWWAWFGLGSFMALALLAFPSGGPVAFAGIVLLIAIMGVAFHFGYILVLRLVPPSVILGAMARPAVATLLMALALWSVPLEGVDGPLARLLAEIALGVLVYAVALLAAWGLVGRPQGIETELLSRLPLARRLIGRG